MGQVVSRLGIDPMNCNVSSIFYLGLYRKNEERLSGARSFRGYNTSSRCVGGLGDEGLKN